MISPERIPEPQRIRVFLIDREAFFREGLLKALSQESDVEVIGEASNGEETLSLVEASAPNVVLVDSALPSLRGFDLARQIKRRMPSISVILLSDYEDDDHLFLAIRAEATAYFAKTATHLELIEAIRRVSQGEYLINESLLTKPRIAYMVLEQFQEVFQKEQGMEPVLAPLFPQEVQILVYVAEGMSNTEIASTLDISELALRRRLTFILRKLVANDRVMEILLAWRRGSTHQDSP